MNEKLIDIANEIIDLLNNRDLIYIEGIIVLDVVKQHILKKVGQE